MRNGFVQVLSSYSRRVLGVTSLLPAHSSARDVRPAAWQEQGTQVESYLAFDFGGVAAVRLDGNSLCRVKR
ncbi:hypothetical protein HP532_23960 [Pseudomonas sp. CrR25]|nr:hypothetical protein [Pseudomonas sp. CrR25]